MPADPLQSSDWTGLLMAGGASRRMGSDKALLMFEGEPLWQRQWRTLREAGASRVLIARGSQPWTEVAGLERVEDAEPECGPLGGLVGALRRMKTPWLTVLAVDLPRMQPGFLRKLTETAVHERRGVVPVMDEHYEPLAAVYSRRSLEIAEELLAARKLALQGFVRRCVEGGLIRGSKVGLDERVTFQNVNSPADL